MGNCKIDMRYCGVFVHLGTLASDWACFEAFVVIYLIGQVGGRRHIKSVA